MTLHKSKAITFILLRLSSYLVANEGVASVAVGRRFDAALVMVALGIGVVVEHLVGVSPLHVLLGGLGVDSLAVGHVQSQAAAVEAELCLCYQARRGGQGLVPGLWRNPLLAGMGRGVAPPAWGSSSKRIFVCC